MWRKFTGTTTVMTGNKKLFFYSVDKDEELFKMNFEGIDTFFKTLDSQGKNGIGNAIILVDGYNDVTTELYEIPQVRKFVAELFKRYPHVLNYVNFDLEGHVWLLSSWLDMTAVYAGKKLTFEEHIKKYGIDAPLPRFNVKLDIPTPLLNSTIKAMREHGNKIKANKNVENQVARLNAIFRGAI
jgi:hypothetical protein